MRILYLSPTEPYPGRHAGFTHVHNLLKNLSKEGVEITLIAGESQVVGNPGERGDIRTDGEGMDIPGLTVHHIPSSGPVLRNLRLYRKIMSLTRKDSFDLIHERYEMAGGAGMMASWRRRIPLVLEVNDPLLELNAGPRFRRILGYMKKRQFGHADAIICQTPQIKQVIWEDSEKHRVFVIPNGADPSQFPVTPFPSEKTIGFMGSFMPWHGVEILLTAFSQVLQKEPDTRLLLVGNSSGHESRLRSHMQELGITDQVTFTGAVPPGDIPGFLSSCTVLTAPFAPELDDTRRDQYRKYGFWWSPLKIFEYMASGRPVVSPALGMVPKYLGVGCEDSEIGGDHKEHDWEGSGLTYPRGDVQALSHHLLTLIRDPDLAMRLGAEGRKRVEQHYNWKNIAHITLMAYHSVLERRGRMHRHT